MIPIGRLAPPVGLVRELITDRFDAENNNAGKASTSCHPDDGSLDCHTRSTLLLLLFESRVQWTGGAIGTLP